MELVRASKNVLNSEYDSTDRGENTISQMVGVKMPGLVRPRKIQPHVHQIMSWMQPNYGVDRYFPNNTADWDADLALYNAAYDDQFYGAAIGIIIETEDDPVELLPIGRSMPDTVTVYQSTYSDEGAFALAQMKSDYSNIRYQINGSYIATKVTLLHIHDGWIFTNAAYDGFWTWINKNPYDEIREHGGEYMPKNERWLYMLKLALLNEAFTVVI